jgi:hypothetical protein
MANYSPLALAMALTIANMAEASTSFAPQPRSQARLSDGDSLIKARQASKAKAELGKLAQRKADKHT